jgi:hypothetical protein
MGGVPAAAIPADTYFVVQYRKTMLSLAGARVSKKMIKEKVLRKICREIAANYDMLKASGRGHPETTVVLREMFLSIRLNEGFPPPPREQLCNRYCNNKHTGAGASRRRPVLRRQHH